MIQINFANRPSEPLTGNWGLLPDPMERARRQTWWKSQRKPGFFFPSYDEDSFWPTEVPGSYHILHPRLEFFEGHLVYRLHFSARPAAPGERVFLAFEGVADRCRVFLNGKLAGDHDGPYTPFSFEVSKLLAEENRFLVYVDCSRQEDSVPGLIHDWFHYGGIHGRVSLYRVPSVFVQEAALETHLQGDGNVLLKLGVRLFSASRDEAHPVTARLLDSSGNEAAAWSLAARGSVWEWTSTRIDRRKLSLWSPDSPALYRLVVECDSDRWEDEVGLREIRTRGRELLLNGEPIFLRGVCTWIHDEKKGLISASAETAARLVEVGRKLGVNYFRAAHWPQSRDYVQACNRAGILLWVEVPAYWMPNMADPTPTRRALGHAEEALCAFRNSPSIVLWSVGNECVYHDTETPQTNLAYFIQAAEFFHAHDPTRLVTFTGGMEGAWTPHMDMICPPELVEHLDVIGINSYAGIHDGADPEAPSDIQDLEKQIRTASAFGKPVLLAENGIDAVLGDEGFDFGETRQEEYYRQSWAIVDAMRKEGLIQGVSYFVLSDFRTPLKLSRHQDGYNRKGLLTLDLKPKKAFHVVAEAYAKVAKEVHLS